MEPELQALKAGGGSPERDRIPIRWSEARLRELRKVARGDIPAANRIDPVLAQALLDCAAGRFSEAERKAVALLDQNVELCRHDTEAFISFLNAFFVVQRFDIVAQLLRSRFAFPRELEIAARRDGSGLGRVGWEIRPSGTHCFTFDAQAFENDNTRVEILAFQWAFPIYANYARLEDQEVGKIIINQQDIGRTPGLAWCDNRPDYFLVPDCIFVPSQGYSYARQVFRENRIGWHDRSPEALWRGATTGIPTTPGDWRSLERIRLCELGRRHAHTGLIDAGISSVIQFADPKVGQEIRESGLMRDPIPWQDWGRYKYLIDIDGNSSPWSNLFQRLLTGSPVLKVESSRGLQQWFYDELVPWRNYVPIAPDMSDLMEKIAWLSRNDIVAQRIGQGGLALAEHLSYEREIGRSAAVVGSAFRHFNGRPGLVGPYGRSLDGGAGAG